MKTRINAQRGIGLTGVVAGGVVLIFLVIAGAKIVPAYIQNKTIQKEFEAILSNPETKDVGDHDIRSAFDKWNQVADMSVIKGSDIDINREGGRVTLSANYEKKIPLAGNATLLLEFNPSASR